MEEMNKLYEISFQIIVDAGDARTKAIQAMKKANEAEFSQAKELLKEARECLKNAHKSQTSLIQQEANGEKLEVNIILVHSQDHFAMATTAIDMAEEVIYMNQKLEKLYKILRENNMADAL